MPEMDGIEVGREILKLNPDCSIVMATGREDRYREAFHIKAVDFITKPFKSKEIRTAIEIVISGNIGMNKVVGYFDRNEIAVKEKQIVYIEAYNGYVQCNTEKMILRKDISLKKMMEQLDGRIFYQIRRELIVNMMWINKYENGRVYIQNKVFNVARVNKKTFEKSYKEFDLNYRKV